MTPAFPSLSAILSAALLAAAGHPAEARSDSSGGRAGFSIPFAAKGRVVGDVSNGMACRYKGGDGLIHCVYDHAREADLIAGSVSTPAFSAVGGNRFGQFEPEASSRYSFLSAETESEDGILGTMHCKLALQFVTSADEIIWIWHDELRFDGSSQYAALDIDGDGLADRAVAGRWNGGMGGSNRWTPSSGNGASYDEDETSFTARPEFGRVGGVGRRRGCDAEGAGVADVENASGRVAESVGGLVTVWRSETRP